LRQVEAGQTQLLATPELICIEVSSSLVKRILKRQTANTEQINNRPQPAIFGR
jgi:hypothetical protein